MMQKRVIGKRESTEDSISFEQLLDKHQLGRTYLHAKRYEDAETQLQNTVNTTKRVFGGPNIACSPAWNSLTAAKYSLGRFKEAEKIQEEVVQLSTRTCERGSSNYVGTLINSGYIKVELEKWAEAKGLAKETIDIQTLSV